MEDCLMKRTTQVILAALAVCGALIALTGSGVAEGRVRRFPKPDFVLRDQSVKGEMMLRDNDQGQVTTEINAGTSNMNIASLSFSGDGTILAVGIDPGRVELWNVPQKTKIRTLQGGSVVALSHDGRLIAEGDEESYQRGVDICQVPSGERIKTIRVKPNSTGDYYPFALSFNPAATLLDATLNGEDDTVYSVSSGKLVAVLSGTQYGQWSSDGASITGGDYNHLIAWNTQNWTKTFNWPNGTDYVSTVAIFPPKDLVVVGGGKGARLIRLSTNKKIAQLGSGNIELASFSPDGSMIFTETDDKFAVWDSSGKLQCSASSPQGEVFAVSPDGRWLAAPEKPNGSTSVLVWNLPKALSNCGVALPK
jgi:WD40 repeat protein